MSTGEQLEVFQNKGKGYDMVMMWQSVAVKSSGVIYVILTLMLLNAHKKTIKEQFSNTDKINLYWLLYLVGGLAMIWFFVLLGNDQLLFFTAVVMVIFMGYFGINQVGIFAPQLSSIGGEASTLEQQEAVSDAMAAGKNDAPKYEKSGLTTAMAEEIYAKLSHVMVEKEHFRNAELKLSDLADVLKVHPNILSQVINTYESKNFYDYINELRIQKFIALLKDAESRKYTIMALAMDCGFNSKSSFNKYFKKVTSQTPTEYMASIKP